MSVLRLSVGLFKLTIEAATPEDRLTVSTGTGPTLAVEAPPEAAKKSKKQLKRERRNAQREQKRVERGQELAAADDEQKRERDMRGMMFAAALLGVARTIFRTVDRESLGVLGKWELYDALSKNAELTEMCGEAGVPGTFHTFSQLVADPEGSISLDEFSVLFFTELLLAHIFASDASTLVRKSELGDVLRRDQRLSRLLSSTGVPTDALFATIGLDRPGMISMGEFLDSFAGLFADAREQQSVERELEEGGPPMAYTRAMVALCRTVFRMLDEDNDGILSKRELYNALIEHPELQELCAEAGLDPRFSVFQQLDRDGHGFITLEDFSSLFRVELTLCHIFDVADNDGNGVLTRRELANALKTDARLAELFAGTRISVDALFEAIDLNSDGVISITEFLTVLQELIAVKRKEQLDKRGEESLDEEEAPPAPVARNTAAVLAVCRAIFRAIDSDNSGYITKKELKHALKTSDELRELCAEAGISPEFNVFRQLDQDHDGFISLEDFSALFYVELLLANIFDAADQDADGVLSPRELEAALRTDARLASLFEGTGVSAEDLFAICDVDQSGGITIAEFLEVVGGLLKVSEPAKNPNLHRRQTAEAEYPHLEAILLVCKVVFASLDTDEDGILTKGQLSQGLKSHTALQELCAEAGLNPAFTVFAHLDSDADGLITFGEFLALFRTEMVLSQIFDAADKNHDGTLSKNEIKRALHKDKRLAAAFAETGLTTKELFRLLDLNKDGRVTIHEFMSVFIALLVGTHRRRQEEERRSAEAARPPTSPSRAPHFEALLATVGRVFTACDTDRDGVISRSELAAALRGHAQLRMVLERAGVDMNMEVFRQLDRDGDGTISREEFATLFYTELKVAHIFDMADKDHKGYITKRELIEALRSDTRLASLFTGRGITVRQLFEALDVDNDGVVSAAEFMGVIGAAVRAAQEAAASESGSSGAPSRAAAQPVPTSPRSAAASALVSEAPHVEILLRVVGAVFDTCDKDKDGVLTKTELYEALREHPELQGICERAGINFDFEVFRQLDRDGDGKITREEFAALFYTELKLAHIFDKADKDKKGYLTKAELVSALRTDQRFTALFLGTGITVRQLFEALDVDHDGRISVSEFMSVLTASIQAARAAASAAARASSEATAPPDDAPSGAVPQQMEAHPHFSALLGLVVEAFKVLDTDGDGVLSKSELRAGLENHPEFRTLLEKAGVRPEMELFTVLDRDRNGRISLEEFTALFSAELKLTWLFDDADQNKDGFLTKKEIAEALLPSGRLGNLLQGTGVTPEALFKALDLNGDGQVSIKEFMTVFGALIAQLALETAAKAGATSAL